MQVFLQKTSSKKTDTEWRPSVICISKDSFHRDSAFQLLNWISYKYGFGTYIHLIEGYYSKETYKLSQVELKELLEKFGIYENHVYVDTLISPSYTSAVAQSIQVPGIAGMENNMVIFEFDKDDHSQLNEIIENFSLVNSGNFDVCLLSSSKKEIDFKGGIHIWITSADTENANLMIMLSFIILSHPDWRKANIRIFEICKPEKVEEIKHDMEELVLTGRLPITLKNIEIIPNDGGISIKSLINLKSSEAALTIVGFRGDHLKHERENIFTGFDDLGNILFVHSQTQKEIE